MSKIKILPQDLIDQIAAGEVVERPASVVKELVENALDAEATFIEVNAKNGGVDQITVRDNGTGMNKEDAVLAFKRYATSKIVSVDDLISIKTFGFRGEALSSIAAVSKFSLQTQTCDQIEGTEVIVEAGEQKTVKPCAHPRGTTVTVSDLFYNLPARRKFLKSISTEFNHIREKILAQSIICPEVGFLLKHNKKEIFNFPESQTWMQRLEAALNLELNQFAPISLQAEYLNLDGFIGLPQLGSKQRLNQFLFINKRFLSNKTVSGAIYKAYENLLPRGNHPPYILSLKIREDLLDVNVHPRKEEIKFVSPSFVFNTVFSSVKSALSQAAEKQKADFQVTKLPPSDFKKTPRYSVESKFPFQRKQKYEISQIKLPTQFDDAKAGKTGLLETLKDHDDWEYFEKSPQFFQIGGLYIVAPQKDGFLIYDQHAADERLLLEEFRESYKKKLETGDRQELLFSETLKLTSQEFEVLTKQKSLLEKVGFDFRFSKEKKVEIEAVPLILQDKDVKKVLKEFVDDLVAQEEVEIGEDFIAQKQLEIDQQTIKKLYLLACHSAVKEGDHLTTDQMINLVERLEKLEERGLTCPHGRPTRIKITFGELKKRFKRS